LAQFITTIYKAGTKETQGFPMMAIDTGVEMRIGIVLVFGVQANPATVRGIPMRLTTLFRKLIGITELFVQGLSIELDGVAVSAPALE
jgi:hypothetical protein